MPTLPDLTAGAMIGSLAAKAAAWALALTLVQRLTVRLPAGIVSIGGMRRSTNSPILPN